MSITEESLVSIARSLQELNENVKYLVRAKELELKESKKRKSSWKSKNMLSESKKTDAKKTISKMIDDVMKKEVFS